MIYFIIYFVLITNILAGPMITINKKQYNMDDLYKEFGSKKDWESAAKSQKKELINSFINRKAATLEAYNIGFDNKPDIARKIDHRSQLALVNITYEELVAKPLVSQEYLKKTRKHIMEERLLNHILIGYNGARTKSPNSRTLDDAFLLAQKISQELKEGGGFEEYVIQYSEDPTALQNKGKLDWIGWGRTVPTFQEAAFILNKGEFSNPVLTDFGYHIIFCEDIRPSEYAKTSKKELENIVYAVARNTISSQLRPAAARYDSLQFEKYNVQYNDSALEKILNEINKQNTKNKIAGQYKIDLIDLFENMQEIGVVALIDNKGYGIKWFGRRLMIVPSGRHPVINDMSSLIQAFDIIVLQYLAIQEGKKNDVLSADLYVQEVQKIRESLLYDQYLKWLVNNADKPDSLDVISYYNKNKTEKYLEDEKVRVREIKVLDKNLADSLYIELKYGSDFIELAEKYSKTNPIAGGLIAPFTKGKYNDMGQAAFNLQPGEFSSVISNLDRTYSIVRVEEYISPDLIPLNRVYNRIESILKRDNQKIAKDQGLNSLRQKYNIVINSGVYAD